MVVVCILMLIFSSGDLSLNLLREVNVAGPTGKDDEDFGTVAEVFRYITLKLQTLTGDGMLVYRCWVVYNKSIRIACLTGTLWFVAFGSAMAVIIFAGTLPGQLTESPPQFQAAMLTFWSTSIALKIICTSLIVYRIYNIDRQTAQLSLERLSSSGRPSLLQRTVRIIIESGVLYTASAIVTLATFASNNIGVYLTSAIEPQIVGITFNLIIIRVHNYTSSTYTVTQTPTVPLRFDRNGRNNQTAGSASLGGVTVTREFEYSGKDEVGFPLDTETHEMRKYEST